MILKVLQKKIFEHVQNKSLIKQKFVFLIRKWRVDNSYNIKKSRYLFKNDESNILKRRIYNAIATVFVTFQNGLGLPCVSRLGKER